MIRSRYRNAAYIACAGGLLIPAAIASLALISLHAGSRAEVRLANNVIESGGVVEISDKLYYDPIAYPSLIDTLGGKRTTITSAMLVPPARSEVVMDLQNARGLSYLELRGMRIDDSILIETKKLPYLKEVIFRECCFDNAEHRGRLRDARFRVVYIRCDICVD